MGIVARARQEAFLPTPVLGVLLNPAYITRSALHRAIAAIAPSIKGSILDFGCGSKPYDSLFTSAKEYIGIDIETSGHDHDTLQSKVDIYYDGKHIPLVCPEKSGPP